MSRRWPIRSRRLPDPPSNARIVYDDGEILPLELRYAGTDDSGIHCWVATADVDLSRPCELVADRVPPSTSITIEGDPPVTDTNPCAADWVRRQRAWHDSELISRYGEMERRIAFEAGYDHRSYPDACGGGGHGRHGMNIRFTLRGPAGATQWLVNLPNWTPGNIDRIGTVDTQHPVSAVVPALSPSDGYAVDLGYHSPTPHYPEQRRQEECTILPEGYCYHDGSGLNALPILAAFLEHGPMVVWAALARYYSELFDNTDDDWDDDDVPEIVTNIGPGD